MEQQQHHHDYHQNHVPQQTKRNKLRYAPLNDNNNNSITPTLYISTSPPATSALNLSLSTTHAHATPVGPFTGYASILSRSRFLRPAQELLEGFGIGWDGGGGGKGGGLVAAKEVMEEWSSLLSDDDQDMISRRCTNPNLLNMLHQVYKKYKLYCQQMQSAVTSFESVAGLANAAPFISFAIRAMFRHFHCLKNAIIDQIRVSNKGFNGVDCRGDRDSGSCPEDKGPYDPKHSQGSGLNFLQHPVWRSQRGFPDKAVAVLRTWLFEHFLHPYPSDSDKQMLAQKTGLSRSQVSNWFTNARVRLWKPMVEEIHTLERKAQCSSKSTDRSEFINLSSENHTSFHSHLTEKDFEIINRHRDPETHSKRTRLDPVPREDQNWEQLGLHCGHLMPHGSNQMINFDGQHLGQLGHHSPALSSHEQNTGGMSWPAQDQMIPFWLARQ